MLVSFLVNFLLYLEVYCENNESTQKKPGLAHFFKFDYIVGGCFKEINQVDDMYFFENEFIHLKYFLLFKLLIRSNNPNQLQTVAGSRD